jgi:hypothetical protein
MAFQEADAGSLPVVVDTILKIRASLPDDRFLWFRGTPCAELSLLPKIMRDSKSSEEVFEREARLLTRFRQRSMAYWPAGYPQNDWEHLFAMQHYGLPTRLLDWSENAFVAGYFALEKESTHDWHAEDCVPAIWCIDPVGWNRSTPVLSDYGDEVYVLTTVDDEVDAYRPETNKKRPATPVAVFGAHNSNRIVAQRGTFMVWGKDTKPLEELDLGEPTLWRVRLTGGRAALHADLQGLGFSETMVFPELQSLAIELSRVEGWRS